MSCSRRQFIQLSAGVALATSVTSTARAASAPVGDTPLPVPPLIESRRGQPLFLTLQRSHWSFSGNSNKVPVWGINGLYLGPTVRVYSGDDVKLIYSNRLNEPVAMTVSGLQVPGALMGRTAIDVSRCRLGAGIADSSGRGDLVVSRQYAQSYGTPCL